MRCRGTWSLGSPTSLTPRIHKASTVRVLFYVHGDLLPQRDRCIHNPKCRLYVPCTFCLGVCKCEMQARARCTAAPACYRTTTTMPIMCRSSFRVLHQQCGDDRFCTVFSRCCGALWCCRRKLPRCFYYFLLVPQLYSASMVSVLEYSHELLTRVEIILQNTANPAPQTFQHDSSKLSPQPTFETARSTGT